MTRPVHFKTILAKTGANTTGVVVPADVMAKLAGGARPAVRVRVNGYSYRTTVGIMGGKSMLPFSAEHRLASGLKGGDKLEVDIEIDREERTLDMPKDLVNALKSAAGHHAAFLKQAPSRQKADVKNVVDAKSPETRARRIAAIVKKMEKLL